MHQVLSCVGSPTLLPLVSLLSPTTLLQALGLGLQGGPVWAAI